MKLVPFSPEHLRLDEPLPFGLRDAEGRLLLAAGQMIDSRQRLTDLARMGLFSDDAESADWHRRLVAAVEIAISQGMSLREVAAVRPEVQVRDPGARLSVPWGEQWHELVTLLDGALRDARSDTDWRSRLLQAHGRARQLYQRRPDASLYHFVFEAAQGTPKYSCHHALLTLLICEQAAGMLAWPQTWIDSLGRAAATMNVAMMRLQDQLASTEQRITPEVRAAIDSHAARGAEMLQAAGLTDPLCLEVVRLHHDPGVADVPLASLPPEGQLSRLLRRVDIFVAKLSRRATRAPMSPVQAAREACLGATGVPDEIGSVLLKAVGLYPPGSFVGLASGEIGIVVARGHRANWPFVGVLVGPSGNALSQPALRDSRDPRFAVKGAVAATDVRVRPPHERLLAMRTH